MTPEAWAALALWLLAALALGLVLGRVLWIAGGRPSGGRHV